MSDPLEDLELIAQSGLASLPPARLGELADACFQKGTEGGDSWLFIVARSLESLAVWWDECNEEAGQGLPTSLVAELDELLSRDLRVILDTQDAREARAGAAASRAAMLNLLERWSGWQHWYPASPPPIEAT